MEVTLDLISFEIVVSALRESSNGSRRTNRDTVIHSRERGDEMTKQWNGGEVPGAPPLDRGGTV